MNLTRFFRQGYYPNINGAQLDAAKEVLQIIISENLNFNSDEEWEFLKILRFLRARNFNVSPFSDWNPILPSFQHWQDSLMRSIIGSRNSWNDSRRHHMEGSQRLQISCRLQVPIGYTQLRCCTSVQIPPYLGPRWFLLKPSITADKCTEKS